MAYAGPEALLVAWLTAATGTRTVTDVPADLTDIVPIYRVMRVGGPSDENNQRLDAPTFTVDSFGVDRTAATNAAITADDALRVTLPGVMTGGATVTRVETLTGPHWAPWDDTTVRRFVATYRLHVKRRT